MQIADVSIVTPHSFDLDYVEHILDVCLSHEIGLLLSCHDLDTLILSRHHARLQAAGVLPLLPSPEWAELALDKFLLGRELRLAGFATPWQTLSISEVLYAVESDLVNFPLVIKPRYGFGSLGIQICRERRMLEPLYQIVLQQITDSPLRQMPKVEDENMVIIQKHLAGPEYCLDLVHDLDGRPAAVFACEVHQMRSGESDSATTVSPEMFGDLPRRLSTFTGHQGLWGVDVIISGKQTNIIEINPRFAGNYPFQHLAGADIPAALLAWTKGRFVDPKWLNPRLGVRGYKDLVPTAHTYPLHKTPHASPSGNS